MFNLNARVGVACIISKGTGKDQKFLIAFHNGRKSWECPGGKLEPGESLTDTVIREVYEELGISINEQYLESIQMFSNPTEDGNTFIMPFFTYSLQEEVEIRLSDEHAEYQWVSFKELYKLALEVPIR